MNITDIIFRSEAGHTSAWPLFPLWSVHWSVATLSTPQTASPDHNKYVSYIFSQALSKAKALLDKHPIIWNIHTADNRPAVSPSVTQTLGSSGRPADANRSWIWMRGREMGCDIKFIHSYDKTMWVSVLSSAHSTTDGSYFTMNALFTTNVLQCGWEDFSCFFVCLANRETGINLLLSKKKVLWMCFPMCWSIQTEFLNVVNATNCRPENWKINSVMNLQILLPGFFLSVPCYIRQVLWKLSLHGIRLSLALCL